MKRGFSMRRSTVDEHAADELDLYIENESDMYRQKQAILKNLALKAKKGIYDKKKAAKLWGYWVQAGARKYLKEYLKGIDSPDETIDSLGFNKATRDRVAEELVNRYPEGREN
jgi:hypothetical protein